MKVCHISSVHRIDDIRVFRKECVSLSKEGYDVTYINPGFHNNKKMDVQLLGNGVKVNSNKLYRILFAGKKTIKAALKIDADIYHIHDYELIRYVKLLKNKNKKVIYDSHENTPMQMMEKEWIPKFLRKPLTKFVSVTEFKNAKKCDLIITVAKVTTQRFSGMNVIQLENLPIYKEYENIKSDWDYKAKNKTFCYSGVIWMERGLDKMCEGILKVKESKLEIVGRINHKNTYKFLQKYENVNYIGYLDRDELYKKYEKAICGLCLFKAYPNSMIDVPTKIYEYMAAGIPTICSNFEINKSVVEKYNCGICVDPENPDEIAKAIKYLLENIDEAKKMGENGKNAIINKLNWEVHKEVLIYAYKKL